MYFPLRLFIPVALNRGLKFKCEAGTIKARGWLSVRQWGVWSELASGFAIMAVSEGRSALCGQVVRVFKKSQNSRCLGETRWNQM